MPPAKCSICKSTKTDSLNYGEIRKSQELTVHLFCLFFSTELQQQQQQEEGSVDSGIDGYELNDIREIISKSVDVKCCYCRKGSATTHCHYPDCDRTFHQPCGFKANVRFEFIDSYRSYCDRHNQIESEKSLKYPPYVGCHLCYEALDDYNPVTTIPSCCGLWFHQKCLREYAINACSAFKCPTCRNTNYADFARQHGIYIPKCAARWEATHDYTDIERYYERCDVKECICPEGRTFSNDKWILQLCWGCGSYGMHKLCRPITEQEDIITCGVCVNLTCTMENHLQSKRKKISRSDKRSSEGKN